MKGGAMRISFTLNGKAAAWDVDPGTSLRDELRARGIV